jgi:hypothetical protein
LVNYAEGETMSNTSILTKQMLIKMAEDIKDNEIVIISNILQGSMHGSSKKKLKGFEIGFTNDCFKEPESISDLMNSMCFGLIIMDKKLMNQETLKAFEEYQRSKK